MFLVFLLYFLVCRWLCCYVMPSHFIKRRFLAHILFGQRVLRTCIFFFFWFRIFRFFLYAKLDLILGSQYQTKRLRFFYSFLHLCPFVLLNIRFFFSFIIWMLVLCSCNHYVAPVFFPALLAVCLFDLYVCV